MRARSIVGIGILSLSVLGFSALVGGCADADRRAAEVVHPGTLRLPLLGTSASGVTYRLTGAFHIEGSSMLDLSADGDVVEAELASGSYMIALNAGWELSRVVPGGADQPVHADLTSANPAPFSIDDHQVTDVEFSFSIDGDPVTMGSGTIRIAIDVNDGLIDDFEDGDSALIPIGGRDGGWFTFNDETGAQMPAPGDPALPELVGGGQGFALRTHGSGFTTWGAGVGANFKQDPVNGTAPYDASGFIGIRFKYLSSVETRFEFDTTQTTPGPAGTCTGICFDGHGLSLPATATWQTVQVSWGELSQRGWGNPAPFVSSELHVMKWLFAPGSFDFSVDDIEFVTTGSILGSWSPVIGFPVIPIHAHVLPTKNLLFWDVGHGEPQIYDPTTGMFSLTPATGVEVFCSGHSFLADGRLLVSGGQNHGTVEDGLATAFAYDPFANTWAQLADMNAGRWYPTNVTLGDGTVLVTSGTSTPGVNNQIPQVYQPGSNSWRDLSNAARVWALYPLMHLAPDGRVFHTGPESGSFFVDVSGTGSIAAGPSRLPAYNSYGTSIVYDEGKIAVIGGDDPPRANVEVIDLNAPTPLWRSVASLPLPRRQHNATILADGKVLVTGGSAAAGFNEFTGATLEAALWDPDTETWQQLAPQAVARMYHSVAVLLPDGRVLSGGGGNPPADNGGTNNFNAEIFSPPYLFLGTRPQITSAPNHAAWGETISVETPDAAEIQRVNLIRMTSVTHSTNMDQRLSRPSFSVSGAGIGVQISSSPNLVPPGPYLLFVVDAQGVPSEGHVISIGN